MNLSSDVLDLVLNNQEVNYTRNFLKKKKQPPKVIKYVSNDEIEKNQKQAQFFSNFSKSSETVFTIFSSDLTSSKAYLSIVPKPSSANSLPPIEEASIQTELHISSLTWSSINFISKAEEFQLLNLIKGENIEDNQLLKSFKQEYLYILEEHITQLELSAGRRPRCFLIISFITKDLKYLKNSEFALIELEPDNPLLGYKNESINSFENEPFRENTIMKPNNFNRQISNNCNGCSAVEAYKEKIQVLQYELSLEKEKVARLETTILNITTNEELKYKKSYDELKSRYELLTKTGIKHFEFKFQDLNSKFDDLQLQRTKLIEELKKLKSKANPPILNSTNGLDLRSNSSESINKSTSYMILVRDNCSAFTLMASRSTIVFAISESNVKDMIDLEDEDNKCKNCCSIDMMQKSPFQCNHKFFCQPCLDKNKEHARNEGLKQLLCPICRNSAINLTKNK